MDNMLQELTETYMSRIDEVATAAADKAFQEAEKRLEAKIIERMPKPASEGIAQLQEQYDDLKKNLAQSNEERARIAVELEKNHKKHLDVLHEALSKEREEAAAASESFESALQAKYDTMVDNFQDRVKREQENRLKRSMEEVERAARKESERAKQAFEMQLSAEAAMGEKMKSILRDMRRQWEEEEVGRAKGIEARLRTHYSTIVDNMETQLKLALRLQDDADKQWLEDVEARNKQQVAAMKGFEDKCRRLYDTRLAEYTERTDQQLSNYEDELMKQGSTLAAHRANFESRIRRMRIACSRWRADYQNTLHARYQALADALEDRYMKEISALLEELMHARDQLGAAERAIAGKMTQTQYRKFNQSQLRVQGARPGEIGSPGAASLAGADAADGDSTAAADAGARMSAMTELWDTLDVPVKDRLSAMVAVLDAAPMTPEMFARYREVHGRLKMRTTLRGMLAREAALAGHVKMVKSILDQSATMAPDPRTLAQLKMHSDELVALRSRIIEAKAQYVDEFGERFTDPVAAELVDEEVQKLLETSSHGMMSPEHGAGGGDEFFSPTATPPPPPRL